MKLKEIILDYCSSLTSLNGIENCKDLRLIKLFGTGISNLDSLINCKKIFNNNKTKWDEETNEWSGNTGSQDNPFWGITEQVDKVGYGNLYQAKYIGEKCREYYPDRGWSDPTLNEFQIEECPNLESVEGLKNSGIQLLVINGCPSIKNIDYLSEFSLLQCCDFTDCANLESVASLSALNLVDVLILKKCYKVKPKPRFLLMDSFEKVNEYLSKFKKNESEIKLDSSDKATSEKLEKLLLSDDYSNIELGLELANSILEQKRIIKGLPFDVGDTVLYKGSQIVKVYDIDRNVAEGEEPIIYIEFNNGRKRDTPSINLSLIPDDPQDDEEDDTFHSIDDEHEHFLYGGGTTDVSGAEKISQKLINSFF